MSSIAAVMNKETRLYMTSLVFYFLGGGYLLVSGLLFVLNLASFLERQFMFMGAQQNVTEAVLQPMLSDAGVLLLMLSPFFTMRILSEERRQGSLELLFTSPIHSYEVVLGKFLAGVLVLSVPVLITVTYALILARFTAIDWLSLLATILGVILLIGNFVAIGLFFSSITSNTFISAMATWGALLFLFLIGFAGRGTSQTVFQYLSNWSHFQEMARGLITTTDIFYFISSTFFFLFLTNRVLEGEGWR
ncbi:MAG: ABC transporter permease [bacterium JZ-2024 1]